MSSDLENDNVMRTKRARRCESRVIPPLHMGGFSGLFPYRRMLFRGDHSPVRCERVRETMPLAIGGWNALPQALTRLLTPIPNGIADHLTRLAAEGDPNPGVVGFFEHKRPQFVQFQRRGSGILWIRGEQGWR